MADGSVPSRYVKLTKDQAPLEDIKPGELNQPIDVPQVSPSVHIVRYSCLYMYNIWRFACTQMHMEPYVRIERGFRIILWKPAII